MRILVMTLMFILNFASFGAFAECTGNQLSESEIAKKFFNSGESRKTIAKSDILRRSRHCTTVTGCSDWTEWKKVYPDVEMNLTARDSISLSALGDYKQSWVIALCDNLGVKNTCDRLTYSHLSEGSIVDETLVENLSLKITDSCVSLEGLDTHPDWGNWYDYEYSFNAGY